MRRKKAKPNLSLNQQNEVQFPPGSLARQIRLARKALREWPQWMKDTAYFAGSGKAETWAGSEDNP